MKTTLFFRHSYWRGLAWGLLCLTVCRANAQESYRFRCRDYVSTDNNRAPQSAFSYDDEQNTFTVSAGGDCNIAFQMDPKKDGAYYIRNTQDYFLVQGTDLSVAAGKNFIWWFNGFNNNGQTAPTHTADNGDGTTLLLWNIRETASLNPNMNYGDSLLFLTSNGKSFIHAMGFTANKGKSTISNIAYYARYEAAATYAPLIPVLGYEEETLTDEIRTRLGATISQAMKLIEKDAASEEKDKMEAVARAAQGVFDTAGKEDYALVFGVLKKLEEAMSGYRNEVLSYHYERTANGIHATLNDMHIHVLFHADSVIRVCKSPLETLRKKSLSVVGAPEEQARFDLAEDTERKTVTLSGRKVRVVYHLSTGQVETFRTDGTSVLKEKESSTSFLPVKDGPNDSYRLAQSFRLDADEDIYGMGQIQDGKLSRRGTTFSLQQDNRFVCIPYFQSSKNYALFWDNYSPTVFTDNEEGTRFQSTGTEIDYYILCGGRSADVLSAMRGLTGKSPMPALWNFGLYQSRERYVSADETRDVVRQYRKLGVPLDCIVQDWQYWGDNAHWNALEFLNPTFANHEEMIRDVHDNHARLMISIWANFGPQTRPYASMAQAGRLLPAESYPTRCGVRPYDVYGETSRNIYWDYLYKGLITKGIDAYWMDSSEPDYFDPKPTDMDYVTETGQTWRALRNAFPLAHVGGVYTHHRQAAAAGDPYLQGKRVSILTRSAFAGQQRYGANTWSGDVTASWENFAAQIPAACNLSVCGIPYWNSDIGGFFLGRFGGVGDPAWRRLYMRWVQFGTFTPMMRFHGTQTPREIYQFGAAGDGVGDFDQILKYVRIRYRLLPYLYSTAWQVSAHDATFMQALAVAFNEDPKGYDVTDEYMFGSSFLVAPVVQDAVNHRDVYLPAGHRWIDFWTGEAYEGGRTVRKSAHADVMPLYVKAGSIVPWGPDVQYAEEKRWDSLEIRVYPGADGRFVLYEDENDTYNYEAGCYSEIPFVWDEATQTLTVGERKGAFEGMLDKRTFRICKVSVRRGIGDAHETEYEATVAYDGSAVSVRLDSEDRAVGETEVTRYIQNPGFEEDNAPLNKKAPAGWTVNSPTTWWGVNKGGGNADPAATEGQYIFGVWDGSNALTAEISQVLSDLPSGRYKLTVDMHAPHKNALRRVGDQCLFANGEKAFFRDQIMTAGLSDNYPFQTVELEFIADGQTPVKIGVSTSGAPAETWFKIDNFRLFRMERPVLELDENESSASWQPGMTDVVLHRTWDAEGWNTLCVPFALTEAETKAHFTGVKELVSVERHDDPVLCFKETGRILAGKPYLVKPCLSQERMEFRDAVVRNDAPLSHMVDGVSFTGTYQPALLQPEGYVLQGDVFLRPSDGASVKGFQAYVTADDAQTAVYDRMLIDVDGKVTPVMQVGREEEYVDVYGVNAVRLKTRCKAGEALRGLPHGVYIVNGKKRVK